MSYSSAEDTDHHHPTQQTLGQSILLHLVPGLPVLALVLLGFQEPVTRALNIPGPMAFYLAATLGVLGGVIPVQLGILLIKGWQRNGRLSLEGVVRYRQPVPWWQYLVFVPLLAGWSLVALALISPPVERVLIRTVFAWFPVGLASPADPGQFVNQPAVRTLLVIHLLTNGLFGPLVEELYFRGYLLPRISRFGAWSAVLNAVLFSLYHFFTPWQNVGRIIALIPLVYVVYRRRSIYIGVGTHILLNVVGAAPIVGALLVG